MAALLPRERAKDAVDGAVRRALGAGAAVCLAGLIAIASVLPFTAGVATPLEAWLVIGLAVAFLGAVVAADRRADILTTLAYLTIGACSVGATTAVVMGNLGELPLDANNMVVALPRCALVLVAGFGTGLAVGVAWTALGWAIGEAAVFLACIVVGGTWAPGVLAFITLVLVVLVRVYHGVGAGRRAATEARVVAAGRRVADLEARRDRRLLATARLHDTALGHLVAIAGAGSGPVDDRLRDEIRRDFGRIIGRDWATGVSDGTGFGTFAERIGSPGDAAASGAVPAGEPSGRPGGGTPPAAASPSDGASDASRAPAAPEGGGLVALPASYAAAANSGLRVRATGDFVRASELRADRLAALDAAVAQCLVNVARHAGVDEAEVAVGAGGGEYTAAVIDAGAGFDVHAVAGDRIGLRISIRGRVEQVGGTVRLWSTPGIGTTVVLTMPLGVPATATTGDSGPRREETRG